MNRIGVLFSGQGSQRMGMGLSCLAAASSSSAFSRTWSSAREFLQELYHFDLSDLITINPKIFTCQRPNGEKVTMRHEKGVLHCTPLAQVALVTYHAACWEEWLKKGFDRSRGIFAGHSLGEISALYATGIFSLSAALELAFERGWIMEDCVIRDGEGRSPFLMYALNPQRCGLSEKELVHTVEFLSKPLMTQGGDVLEIVSYNVAEQQYLITGTKKALAVLGKLIDPYWTPSEEADSNESTHKKDLEGNYIYALREVEKNLLELPVLQARIEQEQAAASYQHGFRRYAKKKKKGFTMALPANPKQVALNEDPSPAALKAEMDSAGLARDSLKRRLWYIPLEHNTVPFHSSILRRGLKSFAAVLDRCIPLEIPENHLFYSLTFVPSVVGEPLALNETFRSRISSILQRKNVGEQWNSGRAGYPPVVLPAPSLNLRELLKTVLLGQFASAVQWTDTMDYLLNHAKGDVKKVYEFSPVPLLSGMVHKQIKQQGWSPRLVQHVQIP